jgi:hypothetical protein
VRYGTLESFIDAIKLSERQMSINSIPKKVTGYLFKGTAHVWKPPVRVNLF